MKNVISLEEDVNSGICDFGSYVKRRIRTLGDVNTGKTVSNIICETDVVTFIKIGSSNSLL